MCQGNYASGVLVFQESEKRSGTPRHKDSYIHNVGQPLSGARSSLKGYPTSGSLISWSTRALESVRPTILWIKELISCVVKVTASQDIGWAIAIIWLADHVTFITRDYPLARPCLGVEMISSWEVLAKRYNRRNHFRASVIFFPIHFLCHSSPTLGLSFMFFLVFFLLIFLFALSNRRRVAERAEEKKNKKKEKKILNHEWSRVIWEKAVTREDIFGFHFCLFICLFPHYHRALAGDKMKMIAAWSLLEVNHLFSSSLLRKGSMLGKR